MAIFWPSRAQLLDQVLLGFGQDARAHPRRSELTCHCLRRALIVARGHDHPQFPERAVPGSPARSSPWIGSATATMPASAPSTATNIAVLPSARRVSAFASGRALGSSPILLHHRHICRAHRASADPCPLRPFCRLTAFEVRGTPWRGASCASAPRRSAAPPPLLFSGSLGQRVFRAALQRSSSDSSSVFGQIPKHNGIPSASVAHAQGCPVLSTISVFRHRPCAPAPRRPVIQHASLAPRAPRGRGDRRLASPARAHRGRRLINTDTADAMAEDQRGVPGRRSARPQKRQWGWRQRLATKDCRPPVGQTLVGARDRRAFDYHRHDLGQHGMSDPTLPASITREPFLLIVAR